MKLRRGLITAVATVLLSWVPVPLLAPSASAAAPSVSCKSRSHPALAARLDRDIDRALRGRVSAVAVGVDDPGQGLQCWLNSSAHFDSASVVKVTILSALLRKAQEQHRSLTRTEAALANHDLNPAARSRVPSSAPSASWGTPDEPIPAVADTP